LHSPADHARQAAMPRWFMPGTTRALPDVLSAKSLSAGLNDRLRRQPGQQLDYYFIDSVLPHGGMATIVRGTDSRIGRQVVIKVPHMEAESGVWNWAYAPKTLMRH
jgi:hypothetical protein